MEVKRAAVFAHFDKDNLIDSYVIYYLQKLKKVADKIIFVSDANIGNEQLKKIKHLVDGTIVGQHGEYDFGSYKRGFVALEGTGEYDEIIFCNDSCYGPLFPLEHIFDEMGRRDCDLWGVTQNYFGVEKAGETYAPAPGMTHIQSYFFVLRKNVFTSDEFVNFISSVKKENNKHDVVINYEIKMTNVLSRFTQGTYIPLQKDTPNPTYCEWKENLSEGKSPFLKVDLLRSNDGRISEKADTAGWRQIIKENSSYPASLIEEHLKRVRPTRRCIDYLKSASARMIELRRKFIRINFRRRQIQLFGRGINFSQNSDS